MHQATNEVDFIVSGTAISLKKAASTIEFNTRYGVTGKVVYELLSDLEAIFIFTEQEINDTVNIKCNEDKYYFNYNSRKYRKI